jgi:hypothetical protein
MGILSVVLVTAASVGAGMTQDDAVRYRISPKPLAVGVRARQASPFYDVGGSNSE